MQIIVSPSLLAADFSKLNDELLRVEKAGADWIHLDVMDGAFVPNISFGAPVITALKGKTKLFFDVHLMIEEPIRYIEDFVKAGAEMITVHQEACEDLDATIEKIRSYGVKVGVSVSPETPVEVLLPYLSKVDMVLIMTVHPGFGGQSFMADMMPKVKTVRDAVTARGLSVLVQVDGGIGVANTPVVCASGADVLVAGSAIFKAENPADVIAKMRDSVADL